MAVFDENTAAINESRTSADRRRVVLMCIVSLDLLFVSYLPQASAWDWTVVLTAGTVPSA